VTKGEIVRMDNSKFPPNEKCINCEEFERYGTLAINYKSNMISMLQFRIPQYKCNIHMVLYNKVTL